MTDEASERLRPHPDVRFAAAQHQFNLEAAVSKLKQELDTGEAGHRQQTLYKRSGVTISLFVFDRLTHLPPHHAKGVVSIHVLKGRLQVIAEGQTHDLKGGDLLILAPGIRHDLAAIEESWLLLTVNLTEDINSSRT